MTTTIHRCGECNHQAANHARTAWQDGTRPRVGPCSVGGCACRLTVTQVENLNPPVEVETWPAYDAATDTWAVSNAFAPKGDVA